MQPAENTVNSTSKLRQHLLALASESGYFNQMDHRVRTSHRAYPPTL